MTDFNLSEKREELFKILRLWEAEVQNKDFDKIIPMIINQDKEFIRLLKEDFSNSPSCPDNFKYISHGIIEHRAGKELTK